MWEIFLSGTLGFLFCLIGLVFGVAVGRSSNKKD